MYIINCTPADINTLLQLYQWGKEYQQKKSNQNWGNFDRVGLAQEIEEKRLWKIVENNTIVCVFLTANSDPHIWGEKNNDPAIYLHRIVTHPAYRGNGYTNKIIAWAKKIGKKSGKKFIRIDTWHDNQKLIDFYTRCGFTFRGIIKPEITDRLPEHYRGISLCLFEIVIEE